MFTLTTNARGIRGYNIFLDGQLVGSAEAQHHIYQCAIKPCLHSVLARQEAIGCTGANTLPAEAV